MKTTGRVVSRVCISSILALWGVAYGQQAPDVRLMDTSVGRKVLLLDPGVARGSATPLLSSYGGITALPTFQPLPFIGNDRRFYAPAGPSAFGEPIDLVSPLRLQRESERKMSTFTQALGAVSAGAVCYMAYQHVRKYGLLK